MREIKFRVWDSLQKKYAFNGFHVIGEVTVFGGIDMVISETREARFAAQGYETSIEAWNDFEMEEWTGFVDKNGKDVYEGDIIQKDIADGILGTTSITFEHGSYVESKYRYDLSFIAGLGVHSDTLSDFIIIGNVRENPDLLK